MIVSKEVEEATFEFEDDGATQLDASPVIVVSNRSSVQFYRRGYVGAAYWTHSGSIWEKKSVSHQFKFKSEQLLSAHQENESYSFAWVCREVDVKIMLLCVFVYACNVGLVASVTWFVLNGL